MYLVLLRSNLLVAEIYYTDLNTYDTKHQPETTARPRTHTTTHAARTPFHNTGKHHHITPHAR